MKQILPAFIYSTGWLLIEAGLAIRLFSSPDPRIKALGQGWTATSLPSELVGLFASVIFLHAVVAGFLILIEKAFGLRALWSKILLYALLTLYIFLVNLIEHPQIFDEFPSLYPSLFTLAKLGSPAWEQSIAVAICLMLVMHLPKFYLRKDGEAANRTDLVRRLGQGAIFAFLAYFFALQPPLASGPRPHALTSTTTSAKRPLNLILIGIDSLRPDAKILKPDVPSVAQNSFSRVAGSPINGSELNRFLFDSKTFRRVITPIALTYGSFYSLLSGRNPVQTGVRGSLQKLPGSTDELLADSPISFLKSAGYRTEFMIDDSKFIDLQPGKMIDSVWNPASQFYSFFAPILLRDRLIFGLFNNDLGYAMIPGLAANAAFANTNRVERYTHEVSKRLRELSQRDQPFLFIAHTCAAHWPASLPYPYYPRTLQSDGKLQPPFSYWPNYLPSVASSLHVPQNPKQEQNMRIYDSAMRYVRDLYLDPLLKEIDELGLLQNSVVVVFSDHGEALWDSHLLPRNKTPGHGTSVLLSDDSNFAMLAIHAPGEPGHRSPANVDLPNLLPTVMEAAGLHLPQALARRSFWSKDSSQPKEDHILESGTFWYPRIDTEIFFPALKDISNYRIDAQRGRLYLDPELDKLMDLSKQRAVIRGDLRLTVFPTSYGYKSYLSDLVADPSGRTNLLSSHLEVADQMLKSLLTSYEPDIQAGVLPRLKLDRRSNELLWDIDPPALLHRLRDAPKNAQYLAFMAANELAYARWEFHDANLLYTELANSSQVNPYIQTSSRKQVIRLCAAGFLPTSPDLDRIIESYSLVPDSSLVRDLTSCLDKLGLATPTWLTEQWRALRIEKPGVFALQELRSKLDVTHRDDSVIDQKISSIHSFFGDDWTRLSLDLLLTSRKFRMSEDQAYQQMRQIYQDNFSEDIGIWKNEWYDAEWKLAAGSKDPSRLAPLLFELVAEPYVSFQLAVDAMVKSLDLAVSEAGSRPSNRLKERMEKLWHSSSTNRQFVRDYPVNQYSRMARLSLINFVCDKPKAKIDQQMCQDMERRLAASSEIRSHSGFAVSGFLKNSR